MNEKKNMKKPVSRDLSLRMRRDGYYRNLAPVRPVTPEDPVRPGRMLLNVCFETLLIFIIRMWKGMVFVSLQAWMSRIGPKEHETLVHLFEQAFISGRLFFLGFLSCIKGLLSPVFELMVLF